MSKKARCETCGEEVEVLEGEREVTCPKCRTIYIITEGTEEAVAVDDSIRPLPPPEEEVADQEVEVVAEVSVPGVQTTAVIKPRKRISGEAVGELSQPAKPVEVSEVVDDSPQTEQPTTELPSASPAPPKETVATDFGKPMEELNAEVGRARDAEAMAKKRIEELEEQLKESSIALVEATEAHHEKVAQLEKKHGEQVDQLLQELELAKTQRDERQQRLCTILADGTFAASVKLQDVRAELEATKTELEKMKLQLEELKAARFQEMTMRRESEREAEKMAFALAKNEEDLAKLKNPPQKAAVSKPPAMSPHPQGVIPAKKSWWRN